MNDTNKLLNGLIVTSTIILFIVGFFTDIPGTFFENSFWWNLLLVPVAVGGCFFMAGIIIYLPTILVTFLLSYFENEFEYVSHKTLVILRICSCVILWVIVTAVVTALN